MRLQLEAIPADPSYTTGMMGAINYNPWDQPPSHRPTDPARRAAMFTWILGAIQITFSGCLVLAALIASAAAPDELRHALESQKLDPEQIALVQRLLGPMAVIIFVLGFAPGVAHLVLGFGVRAGKRLATNTVLLIATTQGIVLGIVVLFIIAGAILTGNPAEVTVAVLIYGSMLALMGYTIKCLLQAKRFGAGQIDQGVEPWNDPTL